jgi:hypothetical protein
MFNFGFTKGTKSFGSSSSSSNPAPWAKGAGFLENFYKWAEAAGMRTPEYYPGSTVAAMNPTLDKGLRNMERSAWKAKDIADSSKDALQGMLRGEDVSKNPQLRALSGAMGAQMNADFGAQSGLMRSAFDAESGRMRSDFGAQSGLMRSAFDAQSGNMRSQFSSAKNETRDLLGSLQATQNTQGDIAQRRLTKGLLQDALPALRGGAVARGGLGGSRNALATGRAVGDVGQSLVDFMAQHSTNYANTGQQGMTALSGLGSNQAAALAGLGGQHAAALSGLGSNQAAALAGLGGQHAAALAGLGGQQAASLGMANAQLHKGAWDTMKNQQTSAMQMAPAIQGMQQMPSGMLMQAGNYRRGYEQQQIDADKSRFDYYQNYPFFAADAMSNWYNRTIPFGSNQSQSQYNRSSGGGGFNFGF